MKKDRKNTELFQPKTVEEMLVKLEQKKKQKSVLYRKLAAVAATVTLTILAVFAVKMMFEEPKEKSGGQITIQGNNENQYEQGKLQEIIASQTAKSEDSENPVTATDGSESGNANANAKTTASDAKLTGVRQSNLMGNDRGTLFLVEGSYLFSVKKDTDGIQNDKIVITKTMDGSFETTAELEETQSVQEFYVKKNRLAVITSDEEKSTSIHIYNIKDMTNIRSVMKTSVNGAWESSCLQDNELFVFTKEGFVGRFLLTKKQQNESVLTLGEKDARYFMSGSEIYSFSDSNEKIFVQKYSLEQNQLVKAGNCELSGMTENIMAVTKSSRYLKLALSNKNRTNGEITFYYVDEDMKGSRKIENERSNELDATARFLTEGTWKDRILCFGRGTDSKGNLSGGIALTVFHAEDSANGESEGNTYLIKEADSAAICIADQTAFLDDDKQRVGFDVYIKSGDSTEHKYYLFNYTGQKFDLLSETNLENSKLSGEVYGNYDGEYLYLADELGTVEIYSIS